MTDAASRTHVAPAAWLAAIGLGLWMATAAPGAAQSDAPLETLLQKLGAYVQQYEKDTAAVVSEEVYWQHVDAADRNTARRELQASMRAKSRFVNGSCLV